MLLRKGIWLAVLLTWLLPASVARADLVFEFAMGGAPVSSIQIPGPGATVPIDVYLRQTGATTILTDEGLAFAGIKVTFADPAVAAVLDVNDIVHNAAFDDAFVLTKAVNPSSADLNMGVSDILSPVFPTAGADRIWLGAFTFTGLSEGTTNIRVTDLSVGFDDIITGLGTPLDGLISAGSGTAEVAAIPEPGSVVLSLLLAGGASVVTALRRRRRRREAGRANRI